MKRHLYEDRNGKQAYETMSKITGHQRNANYKHDNTEYQYG